MDKKRIMAVDDEPGITRMIKLNLEATGQYEVEVENQSTSAIARMHEFRPDLVILDVMMPDIDGGELAQLIDDDATLKNTKVVFLTAIISRDEADTSGSEIAGRVFLPKPVRTEELVACIEQQLAS